MGRGGDVGDGSGRDVVRWFGLLPAVLLIGGGLLDWFTSPDFSATALYSVAPMVAAPLLSLRATVLTGIAACAVDATLLAHFGFLSDSGGMTELASTAAISVMAVVVNRLLHIRDQRVRSARSIAAAVQRAVLPEPPERIGPFRIAVRYEAAHQDAQIGGDLYAVQDTPFGLRCIIGDVRGKGLDAIESVTVLLGTFREAADEEPSLPGLAARLERTLVREADRRAGLDRMEGFATAVLAEVPPGADEIRLLNRGHPAPLLLYGDGSVRLAEPSRAALPLGLGGLFPSKEPDPVDSFPFPPDSTLLLHTDGVTEARNAVGVFYDPGPALSGSHFDGPGALLDALIAGVHRHTGSRGTDDMALLAISRTCGAAG
ncbi:MAG: hypothetical protein QOF84_7777 [Streptomyces sp.]|nr:hypothetical protein [Streptomyces sp.]